MEKIQLDNLSGQEIKELIENGMIKLHELENSELEKVLDFETGLLCHGSGDMNLIRKCSELLDKRNPSDKLNEFEISAVINKTKAEHVIIVNDSNTPANSAPARKKICICKRIAIIAAAILVFISTTLAIATAYGVDIQEYLYKVALLPGGTKIDVGDFTFIHPSNIKYYSSMEDMFKNEKINISYPRKLPDGVYIDCITVSDSDYSEREVTITTTNPKIAISAEFRFKTTPRFEMMESYTVGEYTFYIIDNMAMCYHNGNYYGINADTRENLFFIMNSFKE